MTCVADLILETSDIVPGSPQRRARIAICSLRREPGGESREGEIFKTPPQNASLTRSNCPHQELSQYLLHLP